MLVSAIEKNAEISSNSASVANSQLRGMESMLLFARHLRFMLASYALQDDFKNKLAADV